MLNKLQFNNLVISNKKKIQQSRIQTINKLVHKIRKIKEQSEKRPGDTKIPERLRKSSEILAQLKKIKYVEIIKRILVLDKDAKVILTNDRAVPEELAIAMLAVNKVMQELIKHFTKVLDLKKTDTSWKEELMEMSKRRMKIQRTEEKRKKRQELKEQKAMTRNRLDWLKENAVVSTENEIDEQQAPSVEIVEKEQPKSGTWKVEKLESVDKKQSKPKQNIKEKKVENLKRKSESEPWKVEKLPEQQVKPAKGKDQHWQNSAVEVEEERKIIEVPSNLRKTRLEKNEIKKDEVTHVVDPFFITETGENYLSTAVITRGDDPPEANEIDNAFSRPFGGRRSGADQNRHFQAERSNSKWNTEDSTMATENLHPSWAAKMKQKAVIKGFQGKKIVFGEGKIDEKESTGRRDTTSSNIRDVASFARHGEAKVGKEQSLHPSWAAKQKLKPVIAAFQGKKIKFGNDDS